ncbi:MAG TPA: helix-turn-helix transcriptional regulator [Fimbriimonadaceae bacterium]|nr:helix-turn-helix transcriptional regulator [Fimbriimonadaceae bacterium]
MGDDGTKRPSLGQPKVAPFGVVLRAAIKAEFGSNREFARALGVSEGRVSQIVRGPEIPEPETLERVIGHFSTLALQDQIHRAWVAEFAPLPNWRELEFEKAEALHQIRLLEEAAFPVRALSLARLCQQHAVDPDSWQIFTERIVQLNLRLGKVSPAIAAVAEMEERARSRRENADLLTALWTRGQALRNLESITVSQLMKVHQNAMSFAESWRPKGGEPLAIWTHRKAALQRDFALHVLATHNRHPVDQEHLEAAIRSVETSMHGDDYLGYCAGLEVRARVETAMGQIFKAEETLEELEALGNAGPDFLEKTGLTRARIMVRRGEREAAIAFYKKLATDCFERMNLHHHRMADQELGKVLAGL